MKTSDLRVMDITALRQEVSSLMKAHFSLRMKKATQQLSNHRSLSQVRKDIARVNTIITEKNKEAGK